VDREQAPTRSAVLELKAERTVVGEAYDFLDEKRLLLAGELLHQLRHYDELRAQLGEKIRAAREQLLAGVRRHGLQGLSVYPATSPKGMQVETTRRNLMGVSLLETGLTPPEDLAAPGPPASNPSTEAELCRAAFQEVVALAAVLAGVSGNLYRLLTAYRLTERRARALENVILPDIERALSRMSTYLEELDMEDAIRARPRTRL